MPPVQLKGDQFEPDKDELIDIYIKTFQEPPYLEEFTKSETEKLLRGYADHGKLIIDRNEKDIISILCIEYNKHFDPRTDKILTESGIDLKYDHYIADLIVSKEYRRQGHGSAIMDHYLKQHELSSNIYLRTSDKENEKVKEFYRKLGFEKVQHLVQDVEHVRVDGKVDTDPRIFMAKFCKLLDDDGNLSGSENLYGLH